MLEHSLSRSSSRCESNVFSFTAGRESLSGGALPPLGRSALCGPVSPSHRRSLFGQGLERVQVCHYHDSPLLPPFGTGRVSLGLEGESRPLVTRCLAASPAIAPPRVRLLALHAALIGMAGARLGTTTQAQPYGLETLGSVATLWQRFATHSDSLCGSRLGRIRGAKVVATHPDTRRHTSSRVVVPVVAGSSPVRHP